MTSDERRTTDGLGGGRRTGELTREGPSRWLRGRRAAPAARDGASAARRRRAAAGGSPAAPSPAPFPAWRPARHAGPLALLAAIVWAILYPYSRHPGRGLVGWGDTMLQYWSMAWSVHALTSDPARLFDANVFHPYTNTLAYADHLLGATVLVLPAILVSGNVTLGLNLATLLACFLSAAGAYLLVEDLTRSRLAGIAAALPCSLAPYKIANLGHLNVINAGWIPLALWAVLRLWRGGGWRWSALLAAAVLFQGLSSVYLFYIQLVALGVTAGYLLLSEWGAVRRPGPAAATGRALAGRLARAGAALVVAGLLLLPAFRPYLQVTRDLGVERTIDETLQWAAEPRMYLGMPRANILWSALLPRYAGGSAERTLFPGVVAPALALAGLLLSRRRERWLFAALAAAGVVLTFGPYAYLGDWRVPLPYRLLYETVPGFKGLRVPTRFTALTLLGLAGLAGLAVEALAGLAAARGPRVARLAARLPRPGWRGWRLVGAALALLVVAGPFLVEYRSRLGMTGSVARAVDAPVYRWLAENGAGPVAELPLAPFGGGGGAFRNLTTTVHWRPIVGGHGGFPPPADDGMRRIVNSLPDPAAIRLLQGLEVEHVVAHTADLPADWERKTLPALRADGRLREVARLGPDIVFAVVPDPWMARLVRAVPAGEPVVFPDLGTGDEGVLLELLGVFLRRAGHQVYGSGTVNYHRYALPVGGRLPATAVLAEGADPALYGWLPEEAAAREGGLTLYRRGADVRAARLLDDPALPEAEGTAASAGVESFALRLADDRIERASGGAGTGQGPARAGLLAFVNTAPGEVTFRFGAETRRERLPAGLILYRTPALPAPATVAVEAAPGARLYPRWARVEAGVAAPGLVAARPVVLLAPAARRAGEGTVVVACTILPGAAGEGDRATPYTVSLDIYRRPYGAHPEGHYGNWAVIVPPGDAARRVELTFDIARKEAAATLDGAWTSVAAWSGPPHERGFRAALVVARGDRILGSAPVFEFELRNWRAQQIGVSDAGPRYLPPGR